MDFRIAHVSISGWAGELLVVIFNAKKLRAPADRSMRKMRSQSCRKKIRKVAGERWTRKFRMIFGFCCRLWRLAWSGIVYQSKRAFVSFRNRPLHSRKIDWRKTRVICLFSGVRQHMHCLTQWKNRMSMFIGFLNVSLISHQEFLLQSIYLPDLFALLPMAICL